MSNTNNQDEEPDAIREKVWPPRESIRKKKSQGDVSQTSDAISELEERPMVPTQPAPTVTEPTVEAPLPGEDVNEWIKKRGGKPVSLGSDSTTEVTKWNMPPNVGEWLVARAAETRGGVELMQRFLDEGQFDDDTRATITNRQQALRDRHASIAKLMDLSVVASDGGLTVGFNGTSYKFQ